MHPDCLAEAVAALKAQALADAELADAAARDPRKRVHQDALHRAANGLAYAAGWLTKTFPPPHADHTCEPP